MAKPGDSGIKPFRVRKPRWTIRRLMIAIAVVAFLFGVIRPIYLVFDAVGHGPYTRAFNRRCQQMADDAHLIGRPEADVIAVLGEPTSTYEYGDWDDVPLRTFNYAPSLIFLGKFQVHCRKGVVRNLEQMDD